MERTQVGFGRILRETPGKNRKIDENSSNFLADGLLAHGVAGEGGDDRHAVRCRRYEDARATRQARHDVLSHLLATVSEGR